MDDRPRGDVAGDGAASPSPDSIDIFDLGMTARPDGSAVVVGWVSLQGGTGQQPFHFEITVSWSEPGVRPVAPVGQVSCTAIENVVL